jgi:hypothetical protein
MELKTDISKLKALRADYYNQKADMEDIIHNYKETRKDMANRVTALSGCFVKDCFLGRNKKIRRGAEFTLSKCGLFMPKLMPYRNYFSKRK